MQDAPAVPTTTVPATTTVPPVDLDAVATTIACDWIPEEALVKTGADPAKPADYWDDYVGGRWRKCGWDTRDDVTWQGYPYLISLFTAPDNLAQLETHELLTNFRYSTVNGRRTLIAEDSNHLGEQCMFMFMVPEGTVMVYVFANTLVRIEPVGPQEVPCEIARRHSTDLEPFFPVPES